MLLICRLLIAATLVILFAIAALQTQSTSRFRATCRNSVMLSTYEDLLCRNVTQWFESHDVVTVSSCCSRCRRVLFATASGSTRAPSLILSYCRPCVVLSLTAAAFLFLRCRLRATIGLGRCWPAIPTTSYRSSLPLGTTHFLAYSMVFCTRQLTCKRFWTCTGSRSSTTSTSLACR